MKSVCNFELIQEYEDYANELDMLAYVSEDDRVYLKLGRIYSFCIHADFVVSSAKNVQILGNDCDLTKFAKIKITKDGESRTINPTKVVRLEEGTYKIDYGVYANNDGETYTAPKYTFENCSDVRYIQVDPIVTTVYRIFVTTSANLTGVMFGNPDLYPENLVFGLPYSHNDVIINDHVTFKSDSNDPGTFLMQCPNIGNIYVGDGVKGFTGCFGRANACMSYSQVGGQAARTNSNIKSKIYLGTNVTTNIAFCSQNKISDCIISPNNTSIEYDSVVNGIIQKLLDSNGKKVIITGLGYGYPNNCLKVPSGYTFKNYVTYSGLNEIKIIDLSEYDTIIRCSDGKTGIEFNGFRDLSYLETLILPYNIHFMPKYASGFSRLKNLVVPCTLAPIVSWGGDGTSWYGARNSVYSSSFVTVTNCTGVALGNNVNKANRKLYVIEGTSDEKTSWTEQYDRTKVSAWENTTTPEAGDYDRPNLWCDILKDYDDEGTDHTKWSDPSRAPYRAYTINYLSQLEMNDLILSLNPNT